MSLKDFTIISKLGKGAFSCVFKVQRILDSQIYALKKVKMHNLSDKEQENALNQVSIMASLNSPYIVAYKHSFIEADSFYIVMEYVDGGNLFQKITAQQKTNTTFDEEFIWKMLIYMTLGLKRLHDLNILHRDVKSENVFLDKSGFAKLGDLNAAKVTKNGLLSTQIGTPEYSSPEVWKDMPYNSKSDIWSLGCVAYQLTTLRPPFRAEDLEKLYKKITKGIYPKIGENFSKQLSMVIKSLLQVNPQNRPSTGELLANLKTKAGQIGIKFEQQASQSNQFLLTKTPKKNLQKIMQSLPNSNYNNGFEYEMPKTGPSTMGKCSNSFSVYALKKNSNLNLPKLELGTFRSPVLKTIDEVKKSAKRKIELPRFN